MIVIVCLVFCSCHNKNQSFDHDAVCAEITIEDNILASGFFINSKGDILTAAHSFSNLYQLFDISICVNINGQAYQAMLKSINFDKDIALLSTNISVSKFVDLGSGTGAKSKYAYVIGNAKEHKNTQTKVKVVYNNVMIETDTKSYLGAVFEGDIAQGLSGAPVFDNNGCFLGMVVGKGTKNKQIYALSLAEINNFLIGDI
ncbi:MAG: trypsin-like peptidase domain-containing protein [Clostridiales bacterium]|nr:trypsin-like peptidase domain-containing protein [Clostridiales bacterium]